MTIWNWHEALGDVPLAARVTLGEGNTPLVRSRRIGPAAGLANLWFKLESCNPTGSYKDRFAALAISHMAANGQSRCIATSSGNTGAALAACCAVAGVQCQIAVVETAPIGKLQQMLAYGAEIFRVRGFGVDPQVTSRVFELLAHLGQAPSSALQISAFKYSPLGMAGVRTISYELAEQSAGSVKHVFCPAGGGGLTLAVAQGFAQLVEHGRLGVSPRVHCVQPEGNNTIAGPLRKGDLAAQDTQCTSQISGLQVATNLDGDSVIAACRASGGDGHLVADEATWGMQRRLAREEGVFCEPAGAIAAAAVVQAAREGIVGGRDQVVCLVTGSGFKDPSSIERLNAQCACPTMGVEELEARCRT